MVYVQQQVMEIIEYLNAGVLGAIVSKVGALAKDQVGQAMGTPMRIDVQAESAACVLPRSLYSAEQLFVRLRSLSVGTNIRRDLSIDGEVKMGALELFEDAAATRSLLRAPCMASVIYRLSSHGHKGIDLLRKCVTSVDLKTLQPTISMGQL